MQLLILLVLFLSVLSINAQSTRALQLFELGTKASEKGEYDTAMREFQNTLKIIDHEGATDRFFAKVYYNIGVADHRLGNTERAITSYTKAEQYSNGHYERASYALGLAYSELRNWPEAEKAFRRALIQNNRNGETWFDLAFVYVSTGQNDKAIRSLQKAVKFGASETAVCHNNLGVLVALNGDMEAARQEFKKAVDLSNGSLAAANANLLQANVNKKPDNNSFAIARRQAATE